ncbi:hypothetical protein E2493_07355 [Sphingomonas parva]|uniref:Uncharacterized protein n=1 Tax=Sphingomonas parva TaxID=2555898 RepID=A0A4Y8ZWN4_9SPHN|nr:hypothetical protein [Sphingomonas parva]TFI58876.1 hypothetical protein E2493_07355 [Sphingomonas parva]
MSRSARKTLALSWGALAVGGFAWFGWHELGSQLAFTRCGATGAVPLLLIALLALLLIGTGFALSWRVWRHGAPDGHRFAAMLGLGASGLFAFAIVLQLTGALLLPRCWG